MISNQGEDLVFLLSLPRSGSTILSLLLGNHSLVLCPPEPWFLLKLSTLVQPGNISSVYDEEWATEGTRDFLRNGIFTEAARQFAITAYNRYLLTSGKSVFVDKTPRYYHILPFIDDLFPKARKIWLRRNPLDVALSYKNAWNIDIKEITGQKVTPVSFDFAEGLFNLEAYFKQASPYKFEVQYETLVRSPYETLANICHFVGIPFEANMFEYARNQAMISRYQASYMGDKKALTTVSVHAQSVGKWVQELSVSEVRQIMGLLGFDILRRLDYIESIDTLHTLGIEECSEVKAEEARRRISATSVNKVAQIREQLSYIQWQLGQKDNQLKQLTTENKNLSFEVSLLRGSWSWRLTKPLRKMGGALIKLIGSDGE